MKISTNKEELIKLDACCSGLIKFVDSHGEKETLFSECLSSNGWDDVWWLILSVYGQLSQGQKDDLSLLGCNWAERVLFHFESKFPNDDRPRKAIEAKRKFLKGEISESELEEARVAAESAVLVAALAAQPAARAAARAARAVPLAIETIAQSAARATAHSVVGTLAAREAAMEEMESELMNLFLKWESK